MSAATRHKSKALASLCSALAGALGVHRFYLYGRRDAAGWAYVAASSVYLGLFAASSQAGSPAIDVAALFPLPAFVAAVEALTIGLTDDGQWDRQHNGGSARRTRSRWPLALLLVLTFAATFTGLVAAMARATDLLHTGGSFG